MHSTQTHIWEIVIIFFFLPSSVWSLVSPDSSPAEKIGFCIWNFKRAVQCRAVTQKYVLQL